MPRRSGYNARVMKQTIILRPTTNLPARTDPAPRAERTAVRRWMDAAPWLALAVAGAALILVRTRGGVHVSPDSISYLAAGRSLAAGRGLIGFDGSPYVDWPPLFPAAIAAASAFGVHAEQGARWVNALAFGALVGVCGACVRALTRSTLTGVAASAVVLRAAAVAFVATYAWSEPLFLLLSILSLVALWRYAERGGMRLLSAAALLAGGAVMARYAGVSLVAAGCIVIVARRVEPRAKARDLAAFVAIALAPFAAWLIRNAHVSGTLTGGRDVQPGALGENVAALLETFGGWIVPVGSPPVRIAAGAVAVCAVAAAAARCRRGERRWAAISVAAFLAAYSAVLLAMATLTTIDAIGDRLAAPLLPPAAVLLALGAADGVRRRMGWTIASGAALGAWLIVAPLRAPEAAQMERVMRDYSSPRWRSSPLVAYLRAHPPRGAVFSDDPWGAFHCAHLPARTAPVTPDDPGDDFEPSELADLRRAVDAGETTYVVWFAEPYGGRDPGDLLADTFSVDLVHRDRDGAVYRLAREE